MNAWWWTVILSATAACSTSAGASTAAVKTNTVEMPPSYRFEPQNIEVVAGTTVTWHNSDNFTHSVQVEGGEVKDVKPGESTSITFDQPGNHDAPSAPARVASVMAGKERGMFFMPEVGDEVVVAFEAGNINRPVIIGALWSDVDRPPPGVDTSASNNIRTITSRAGHQVTFDDSPTGKITIKTKGGFEITIEDGPSPKINLKTTGVIATSRIVMDGVAWNHQHATGTGPSGPPLSIVPVV